MTTATANNKTSNNFDLISLVGNEIKKVYVGTGAFDIRIETVKRPKKELRELVESFVYNSHATNKPDSKVDGRRS